MTILFSSSCSLCRRGLFFVVLFSISALMSRAQEPRQDLKYPYGPDSFRHEGVPRGKVSTHEWKESKIFPDAKKPAALMVFQDGHAYIKEDGDFRVPVVFDNLIHKHEMPVTIGVFVDPGHRKAALPEKPGWKPDPEQNLDNPRARKMPYAPAIAIGTMLSFLAHVAH